MWTNWRHRITTSTADPTNPNQNGAVIPNVLASRLPIGVTAGSAVTPEVLEGAGAAVAVPTLEALVGAIERQGNEG